MSRRKPPSFPIFFYRHFLLSFLPSSLYASYLISFFRFNLSFPFLTASACPIAIPFPFLRTSPLKCDSSEKRPSKCAVQRVYQCKYSIVSRWTSLQILPAPNARFSIRACKDRTRVLTLGCRRCQHFTDHALWCTVPCTANYIHAANTRDTSVPSMTIDVA